MVNAGTVRRVTVATIPSAPSPTRAARSASGSESPPRPPAACRLPSTSSIASICEEMLRKRDPVPWVAVETAPAIVCLSMSPRFSRARPVPPDRLVQHPQADAGLHLDPARLRVDVEHPAEAAEIEHHTAGARDVGEGVALAHGAHLQALLAGARDRVGQVGAARGRLDPGGLAALVAGPVAPLLGHREDPNARAERQRQRPIKLGFGSTARRGGRAVECDGLESR